MNQMEEGASSGTRAQPLQPGDVLLQSNIVLHEKRPISEGSCVFRGTFGSKIMRYKEIAIKIVNDGELERREAELHHSLPQHSNLVRSIQMDAFDYQGKPSIYIAMELCEINLYEHIVRQKESEAPFDPIKYLSFAKDIARGLSFLHARKKIHRNLKPSNILLTEHQTIAKISDYCMSRALSGATIEATQPRSNACTEGSNSPDILRDGAHISTSTDIFFCGIIFAFMWSYGKHPYGSDCHCWNYSILISKHQDLEGILLEKPTLAKHLVSRMLNRNSEERPTADEVLRNEIFNQEDEAAKLKIPNNVEETRNLEHVKIDLEKQLFNKHLELVEHNISVRKYEAATKYQEELVKFVEYQNSSLEEVQSKAEHYSTRKKFIRSFVLFHTAAKLVKVKAAGMAEARVINKIVKKMNKVVLGIYKEDKSKEDIFKDYFIWCMNQFTVEEMTKRNAPKVFLEGLRTRSLDAFSGFYLVPLIENKILDRNYEEAEKILEKLFQFMKLQLVSIEEITSKGQDGRERLQYINACIVYILAAGMAKSTMNGTEVIEVIYGQMEIIGLLVGEIMRDQKSLWDIIFDHIIPSTSQFTVAALQEEGKILEAGYLMTKYEERIPMMMVILVDLRAFEQRAGNPTYAKKFQESLLQISESQKLTPSHLNSVGQIYVQKNWFFKAFILYVSAVELSISKLNADEVVESFEVLFRMMMDEIEDYHHVHTDVNPIAKFIIISMDKLKAVVTRRKDMTEDQKTLVECWSLLSIGVSYGVQYNWKEAVRLFESTAKILKKYLYDEARLYKVLVFAMGNLVFSLYKNDEKDRAITFCTEAQSVIKHVKDWDSDEQKKRWISVLKENAKHFRGQSGGIGAGLKSWIGRFPLRNRSQEP